MSHNRYNRFIAVNWLLCLGMVTVGCGRSDIGEVTLETGREHLRQQRWSEVIQESETALERVAAEHYEWLLLRGKAHLAMEQYAEAETILQRAVQSFPDESEAYYQLAIIYNHQGDADKAGDYGRRARERDPEYRTAFTNDLTPANPVSVADDKLAETDVAKNSVDAREDAAKSPSEDEVAENTDAASPMVDNQVTVPADDPSPDTSSRLFPSASDHPQESSQPFAGELAGLRDHRLPTLSANLEASGELGPLPIPHSHLPDEDAESEEDEETEEDREDRRVFPFPQPWGLVPDSPIAPGPQTGISSRSAASPSTNPAVPGRTGVWQGPGSASTSNPYSTGSAVGPAWNQFSSSPTPSVLPYIYGPTLRRDGPYRPATAWGQNAYVPFTRGPQNSGNANQRPWQSPYRPATPMSPYQPPRPQP